MEHPIALIDDHHLVRSGIAATINNMEGYRVVLEAGDGEDFIEKLKDGATPRIAVVDLNMPIMDGYATIKWLRANRTDILPIALTFDATEEAMVKAVRMGARGFLLKNSRPETLRQALDSLLAFGYYYTDELNERLERNPDLRTPAERERERIERLTDRELEFLRLVCDERELTYDKIAETMGVHRRTIDGFRTQLFEKFKIKSKTGLVLFAMRWKLVE